MKLAAAMHPHHKRALLLLVVAAVADAAWGTSFALADHVSVPDGIWFTTVTATTVGYGDVIPRGWLPHLVAAGTMLTVIPLFGAAFALFSSGLASTDARAHVDKRLTEHYQAIRDHVDQVLAARPPDDDEGEAP